MNFTVPLDLQPYTFMYRRPTTLSRAGLFIDPFTPLVLLQLLNCLLSCYGYWACLACLR